MTKRIEEYETLLKKYYALQQLIDEDFLEALEDLESAISYIESSLNYIKCQKVIRSKMNGWLREYGDMYDFNPKCPRCTQLANEIKCLTSELVTLDNQAYCMSKNAKKTLNKAKNINAKLSKLKREYNNCIAPDCHHHLPHEDNEYL